MTDEIIIDGVDVSKCKFYSKTGQCKIQQVFQRNEIVGIIEKPYGNHLECNLCNKICYYKQLEQEIKDYTKLNKENNQLKKVAAKLLIEKGVFISTLDKLRKIIDEKLEKENKLINTLQDIKTLVTTNYIQIKRQLVQNYDCLDNFMQKIEDKCSEVID